MTLICLCQWIVDNELSICFFSLPFPSSMQIPRSLLMYYQNWIAGIIMALISSFCQLTRELLGTGMTHLKLSKETKFRCTVLLWKILLNVHEYLTKESSKGLAIEGSLVIKKKIVVCLFLNNILKELKNSLNMTVVIILLVGCTPSGYSGALIQVVCFSLSFLLWSRNVNYIGPLSWDLWLPLPWHLWLEERWQCTLLLVVGEELTCSSWWQVTLFDVVDNLPFTSILFILLSVLEVAWTLDLHIYIHNLLLDYVIKHI